MLTEHFTRHSDFGQEYFTVTAVVEDQGGGGGRGGALSTTSSTFKKEPNNSKFAQRAVKSSGSHAEELRLSLALQARVQPSKGPIDCPLTSS